MALEITDTNFETLVGQSNQVVLLDFWAHWCQPCVAMAPIMEELHEAYKGRAIVGKVNVIHNPKTVERFKIMGIPAFYLLKDGEVVEKHLDSQTKGDLAALIDKYL